MPQSLSQVILHVIFSTKDRFPFLQGEVRPRLHGYMAELCRDLGSDCRRVGGTADHVHLATTLPRTLAISDLLEDVKKKSSKWVRTEFSGGMLAKFHWQAGYGAFSVSPSGLDRLVGYIDRQEEHHRRVGYQDELRKFLRRYGVAYDERYLWD